MIIGLEEYLALGALLFSLGFYIALVEEERGGGADGR